MRTLYGKNDLCKSFGLAVAVMLFASVVLSLCFSGAIDPETKVMADWAFWLMQALYTLIIGSVTFIYAAATRTNVVSATKMNVAPRWAHVVWGCGSVVFLVALMLPVNEWFLDLIELCGLSRPEVDMPMQVVPMLLIACVLPSFTEELLFRGTVSRSLEGQRNKLASLAICGALFSLFHLNAAQTLHQFVLGAFLTLLAFRSGSAWTTVIVHFFNNALAVALTFLLPSEVFIGYDWVFAVVGAVGFAACVFGYVKTTKSSWQQADGADDAQAAAQPWDKTGIAILVVAVSACVAMWVIDLLAK